MTFSATPLTPRIASRVTTDKAALLSGAHAGTVLKLLEERGVLVFPQLNLTDQEQIAFGETLGTVMREDGDKKGITKITLDKNVNVKADYLRGSMFWHIDGTDKPMPLFASLLTAKQLSREGGQTEFCNTYAAYDDLPEADKQAIANLRAVHSLEASQYYVTPEPSYEELKRWRSTPTKSCPLVWTHQSGRKSLVLGSTCGYVEGMSIDDSRELLIRLRDWATQPQFVYQHQWTVGDLVMWDNTGTMHRVLPYPLDSGRLMHRTGLAGVEPLV